MVGVYPARGCVYTCNFCSVIMIAGRQIRSQSVETTIASLRAIKKAAGIHNGEIGAGMLARKLIALGA